MTSTYLISQAGSNGFSEVLFTLLAAILAAGIVAFLLDLVRSGPRRDSSGQFRKDRTTQFLDLLRVLIMVIFLLTVYSVVTEI